MSSIVVQDGDKIIQTLIPLPREIDLFNFQRKEKRKPGKSTEQLTAEIYNHLVLKGKVEFNVKDLTKDIGEEVTRVYDILNVFEGLGLVTKSNVSKYSWVGEEDGMMPTLKQLRNHANSQNLVSIFLDPTKTDQNVKGEARCSLQFLTGKMMMLLLILDPSEGLSKADFSKFIFQNVSQKTMNSAAQRIVKVLKVLESLKLIRGENKLQEPPHFKYIGPYIDIADIVLVVVADGQDTPAMVDMMDDSSTEVQDNQLATQSIASEDVIDDEAQALKCMKANIQEPFPGTFAFGDYFVKDEVMDDDDMIC